jgi:hypothetical protein
MASENFGSREIVFGEVSRERPSLEIKDPQGWIGADWSAEHRLDS